MVRKFRPEPLEKPAESNDHASLVRGRILNSAKELLSREGYSKTTIRKIVDHSGVLTGSIYYFFKNKEDIFKAILLELVRECIKRIDSICKDESPLFKYIAVCQVELKVLAENEVVRETYRNGYNSNIIFEGMIAQYHHLARKLFNGTKYEQPDELYYQNTLMIKGAMHACLTEMFFQREIDMDKTRETLLRLVLRTFGVDAAENESILQRVEEKSEDWGAIGKDMVETPLSR